METRKLYKQGKSTVLVIPSKYLKALNWSTQDEIWIILLPNSTLNLSRGTPQEELLKSITTKPKPSKEVPNVDS